MSRESPLRGQLARLRELSDETRAAQVDALCDRLDADRLRVLLVGEAKRGKSTLGNALVGRAVLPSGVIPVTAVSTTVRRGIRDGLEVRYRDGTLRAASLSELADLVTEARNPGNRLGVAEVTAFVSGTDLPAGVDLVDTPGMGSVHAHNTTETTAALVSMDAAVLVLTADPPISASELALLQRVQQLSVHTLVVLNKADRLSGQERGEVLEFTQAAIGTLCPDPPPLFACSARQGLAARQDGDSDLWRASGLAQLQTALLTHLSRHRQDDLLTSLTRATGRLARELLDEATVQVAAQDLRAARREADLAAFRQRLSGLDRRRDEALAVADADAARLRHQLDQAAADHAATTKLSAEHALTERLADLSAAPAGVLEDAGRAAIVETVGPHVEAWRQEWAARLDDGLGRLCARQQELLDEAVADVRAAAREHLGIDLQARADTVVLPPSSRFYYSFDPQIGWGLPASAAVRRGLPGRWGRHRVQAHLRSEVERLAEVHHGRARSDFQYRLQEAIRGIRRAVEAAYTERTRRLTLALDGLPATGATVSFNDGSAAAHSGDDRTGGGITQDVAAGVRERMAALRAVCGELGPLVGSRDE